MRKEKLAIVLSVVFIAVLLAALFVLSPSALKATPYDSMVSGALSLVR